MSEKSKLENGVFLRNTAASGSPLEVTFLPEKGMNLVSYRKGDIEAIDQSTWPLFEERYAGLGALIGPHFHTRKPELIPPVADEARFPHIARIKAQGRVDPFSHGIGRYAPWTVEHVSEERLEAVLTGKDVWNGVSLADLEGQDFTMHYKAHLSPEGLTIALSVVSETDSVVGFHTYYALSGGEGVVSGHVQSHYNDQGTLKPLPKEWTREDPHHLIFPLTEEADFGFHPYPDPLESTIRLETKTYSIRLSYQCTNQENAWQLWHPRGASFVCIEPLSAKDPRSPHLSVSSLKICISIL